MSYYVKKALDQPQHPQPKTPQYATHHWKIPACGKRLQMTPYPGERDLLDK